MTPELRLINDPEPELASAADFAAAMSALASGVVLVTCRLDGRRWGMTVTAFASVSADPPTVLVSLASESRAARAIAETRRFGVGILSTEQLALAQFAATPDAAKFLDRYVEGDALAHLECEVCEELDIADHTVFFGSVRTARALQAGAPLLYHRRDYRTTCFAN